MRYTIFVYNKSAQSVAGESFMQKEEYHVSQEISFYRRHGQTERAIEVTENAIERFPDSSFFCKILGDLAMSKEDYRLAGSAYVDFLTKIGENLRHFKNFVNFWERYQEKADKADCTEVYNRIVELVDGDSFSVELKKSLASVLFEFDEKQNCIFIEVEKNQDSLANWINSQEKNGNLWNIYCFLYWEKEHAVHTRQTVPRDIKLVAIIEKYEFYEMALDITEMMLDYNQNDIVIRTLFRLCRKLDDYARADAYIESHPEVRQRAGFNIQYEFVYYYLNKGDETSLLDTLKKIRNSATSSIPISKTLQNFYVKLGMIDDAVEMRRHISQLEQSKKGYNRAGNKIKGTQEERETEEAFWDTIKDMVSEQEHNRQLIAIKELLKGFSHELGQPITNIRYGVQLYQMKMERNLDDRENLEELLDNILMQTIRVKRLLKRFAPIVSSKSVNSRFNCIEHIKAVFLDMQMRLDGIGIETQIDGIQEFTLYGDSLQFEQVIYNLVSNSADELREKDGPKRISVLCKEHDNVLNIHFRDNGRGVPKDIVNKIFNPFYSTKDKEKSDGGEGLGLYIVWNILKMYGGKIRVNTAYKEGAEFLIQIPKGEMENV